MRNETRVLKCQCGDTCEWCRPELCEPGSVPVWKRVRYPRVDPVGVHERDVRFFKGLAIGLPISLAMWVGIVWLVRWLVS